MYLSSIREILVLWVPSGFILHPLRGARFTGSFRGSWVQGQGGRDPQRCWQLAAGLEPIQSLQVLRLPW
jgi:hypothetical protein